MTILFGLPYRMNWIFVSIQLKSCRRFFVPALFFQIFFMKKHDKNEGICYHISTCSIGVMRTINEIIRGGKNMKKPLTIVLAVIAAVAVRLICSGKRES